MRARSTLPLLCSLAIISVDPPALARSSLYRGRASVEREFGRLLTSPKAKGEAEFAEPRPDVDERRRSDAFDSQQLVLGFSLELDPWHLNSPVQIRNEYAANISRDVSC